MTLTFGDQLKEYQTIFAATNALQGAQYKVDWTDFVGGPPVIAAETGGSVDLGDMAETPTIFAQSAGDPVKVVAATQGANPKVSPYDIVVPTNSPIKTAAQLKGQTVAVQEGTVEQYFLVQYLAKNHIPYTAVHLSNLPVTSASTAVTNGQVAAAVISQPLTALDQATGKVRVLATGAGYLQVLGYLTASNAALANPQKAAALQDFIKRFYKASAILRKNPLLAARDLREDVRRHAGGRQGGGGVGPGRRHADHAGHHQLPADRGQHLPEARTDTEHAEREEHLRSALQQGRGQELQPDVVTVQVAGKPDSGQPIPRGRPAGPPDPAGEQSPPAWCTSPSETAGSGPGAARSPSASPCRSRSSRPGGSSPRPA